MKDENEAALPLKYKAKSSLSLCRTHEHFKLVWNLVLAFLINKLRPKSVNATGLLAYNQSEQQRAANRTRVN